MAVRELKIGKKFIQIDKGFANSKQNNIVSKEDIKEKVNLPSENLMKMLMDKIDSIENKTIVKNIYGESMETKDNGVIDVDFKKELYIQKLDKDAVKSEEIKGKVNNKLDKLKALRKRNGS